MGRRKRRDQRRQLDPDDVLAGRVSPDADELIDLVHAVNPTDLGLPAAAEARRYRQKSALQSLLIRRYAEYLEVVPEDGGAVLSSRVP